MAGPGQPKECEAGNMQLRPRSPVIGNTSTPLGTAREETKRNESLYGETYPRPTQKDLGLKSEDKQP